MANTKKKPAGRYLRRHSRHSRHAALVAALALILVCAVGATTAFLLTQTSSVTNMFMPSHVSCSVTESFNSTKGVKSDVNVRNTGDTEAYIRVKLVSYRTNDAGDHIGGTTSLPAFTLGANWVFHEDGYYYYTLPVKPGESPVANLADSMTLTGTYDDADGGHQAIDVMAEAIQSSPAKAVGEAWGVSISEGAVSAYSAGN